MRGGVLYENSNPAHGLFKPVSAAAAPDGTAASLPPRAEGQLNSSSPFRNVYRSDVTCCAVFIVGDVILNDTADEWSEHAFCAGIRVGKVTVTWFCAEQTAKFSP